VAGRGWRRERGDRRLSLKFGVEIPFVSHLGFDLVVFEGGQSQIDYEPRPEHLNSFGVTHGGACMTLLDVVMATGRAQRATGHGRGHHRDEDQLHAARAVGKL
jgi:acyl-coenzyme A thioesterase PaaI-like protein